MKRNPDIVSRFGATVRGLRYRLGISQEELAGLADLHRTYIAGIEAGSRNVTLKSIEKLARALAVSTSTLLTGASDGLDGNGENREVPLLAEPVEILLVENPRSGDGSALRVLRDAKLDNPVVKVSDGSAALDWVLGRGRRRDRAGKNRPRMVLLDLSLPKGGAIDVLRRLKGDEAGKMVPVIVLTTSKSSREFLESMRLGADSFVLKPVGFQALANAVAQLNCYWKLFRGNRTAVRSAP